MRHLLGRKRVWIYNPKIVGEVFRECSIKMSTHTPKPSVFVTRRDVPDEGLRLLRERCHVEVWPDLQPIPQSVLKQKVVGKDALFCLLTDKIDNEVLDAAGPGLKVIGTMSVGYDHIDLQECKKRKILVGNTPGVLTDATSELAVALLLATSRRLFEANRQITSGGWADVTWSPTYMCGSELRSSTVGIVGMGNIGQAIMEKLKPFKVSQFLYTSRKPKPQAEALGAKIQKLEDLLRKSDFVIVCCSLNEETRGMFNKSTFSLMKNSAIFINISRGAVVDQDALYNALVTGQIQAAGLDVMVPEPLPPSHPLTKLHNCILLPHIGSAGIETRSTMAVMTAQNILAGLEGKPLPASV